MTSVLRSILVAAALLSSVSVQAKMKAIHCTGTVIDALVYADGNLNVSTSWRNDYTVLCNVNKEPTVCALWSSIATAAVKDQKKVAIWYSVSDNNMTCANLPTYGRAPKPVYFGVVQ